MSIFAVSRAAWDEFLQMVSDRMDWVRESGIWIVLVIFFVIAMALLTAYAVARWHYGRRQSRWRLW